MQSTSISKWLHVSILATFSCGCVGQRKEASYSSKSNCSCACMQWVQKNFKQMH